MALIMCKWIPNSTTRFSLFLLSLSSTYYFQGFLCQGQRCPMTFDCANIYEITYPFWNADEPRQAQSILCGHPGFGLNCGGDVPVLIISKRAYRVLDIEFYKYTLTVARQDLWNNTCHPILTNTPLASDLFKIPSDSDNTNVTLYYNCSADASPPRTTLPNQFNCGSTTNLFQIGTGNATPTGFTCHTQITVSVNGSNALKLKTARTAAAANEALQAALAGGFKLSWVVDNAACSGSCSRLHGACAYDLQTNEFHCDMRSSIAGIPVPRQDNPAPGRSPPHQPTNNNAPNISPSPNHHNRSNRTQTKLGLAFGTIGLTLLFGLIIWCCRTQYFPRAPKNPNMEKFLFEQGSLAPKRYTYSQIKKMTKSFNDKLGQGGYGSVYKGMLPNGCPVAVKVLIEMDSNDEEFINEVASISRTSHVNIVTLLGFCYERNKRALVYEFMPNKSLDKFMGNANTSLDMERLYKIVTDVAKGLAYLHRGCSTSIIHFDIKPQNILLDDNFNPKISDFGLAKLCKKKTSLLSVLGTRGTVGYIAPEVFSRNFGSVSHKSDVYSYGIMILELAGARDTMDGKMAESSDSYFPDKIYEHATRGHGAHIEDNFDEFMIEAEDESVRKMFLVGFWCIQTMPSDRPPMSKVIEMLEGNLESIQIPPKPFLFNPKQLGPEFSPSMSVNFEIEDSTQYRSALATETASSSI